MECPKINPALSLLMKHLVIGQRQKLLISSFSLVTTRLSGFHWSGFRNHEGSEFTEKDRNRLINRIRPNHRIGLGYAGRA